MHTNSNEIILSCNRCLNMTITWRLDNMHDKGSVVIIIINVLTQNLYILKLLYLKMFDSIWGRWKLYHYFPLLACFRQGSLYVWSWWQKCLICTSTVYLKVASWEPPNRLLSFEYCLTYLVIFRNKTVEYGKGKTKSKDQVT